VSYCAWHFESLCWCKIIPENWKVMVKIYWTLLTPLTSIPGKIMAKVMLNRMRRAVDEWLRQEQAGFRPGRSCCEQTFTLIMQIIEKTVKHETRMLINFVDFKKAFDSVHTQRVTLEDNEKLWDITKNNWHYSELLHSKMCLFIVTANTLQCSTEFA